MNDAFVELFMSLSLFLVDLRVLVQLLYDLVNVYSWVSGFKLLKFLISEQAIERSIDVKELFVSGGSLSGEYFLPSSRSLIT